MYTYTVVLTTLYVLATLKDLSDGNGIAALNLLVISPILGRVLGWW